MADTTALILFSTVGGLFTEIVVAGLSVEQSVQARLTSIPVILVTALPYGIYRDYVVHMFDASGATRLRKLLADTAALITFQLPLYWAILLFAGASVGQIAAASVTAVVILAVAGRPYGLLLDLCRRVLAGPRATVPPE
jgi:L-alanine exporter